MRLIDHARPDAIYIEAQHPGIDAVFTRDRLDARDDDVVQFWIGAVVGTLDAYPKRGIVEPKGSCRLLDQIIAVNQHPELLTLRHLEKFRKARNALSFSASCRQHPQLPADASAVVAQARLQAVALIVPEGH
jgi:hypothetical protein